MARPPSPSSCPLAGKKIVVAGAGIAGLAFAISLQHFWNEDLGSYPEITLYEREEKEPGRGREGYSLSIRGDSRSGGVQALQKMGVLEKLLDVSITGRGGERGSFGFWDPNWKRIVEIRLEKPRDLPASGMRIARWQLRRVLTESVAAHTEIVWGVACLEVLPSSDTKIRVRLSDGKEEDCDFLVAADGASSKLRASVRPADILHFAGAVSIGASSRFPGAPPVPVNEDWGMVFNRTGTALFVSPVDDRSALWNLSYIADSPRDPQRQPLSPEQTAQILQEAKERGKSFKEPFQTLVDNTDVSTLNIFNANDKQPFPHGKQNGVPNGIVFIGDSNHAVSPFAGNGANMALMDAFDLAECLCGQPSIEQAVNVYDKRSMPRCSATVKMSHFTIGLVHSTGLRGLFYRAMLGLAGVILSVLSWRKRR
ncbi:FAD/NAD(P)-binding domain-containing protein [Rhizodiscina lignyota]|uniref:FAD/NAD(P)-binding domain-containing protein n=1 Tax=Rhizodiscina lignyota TaxID=1504668 RepID=A0A9P4IP81_9PEZI|nr:FAD/NAD(P)-binding domain-containing protein [Rhizodiscina lignyota]